MEASLISSTAPIFVIIAGIIFLREKQEKHEWLGLALAIVGTLLIALKSPLNHFSPLGNLLVLSQNLIWAGYLILAKRYYHHLNKFFITSLSFWVGLASFFVLSRFTTPGPILADLSQPLVLLAALYMAVPGSILALTLYLYGQNLI